MAARLQTDPQGCSGAWSGRRPGRSQPRRSTGPSRQRARRAVPHLLARPRRGRRDLLVPHPAHLRHAGPTVASVYSAHRQRLNARALAAGYEPLRAQSIRQVRTRRPRRLRPDRNRRYPATTKRTAPERTGCADLPSVHAGSFGPVHGRLAAAGEVDCYKLPAATSYVFRFTSDRSRQWHRLFVGTDGYDAVPVFPDRLHACRRNPAPLISSYEPSPGPGYPGSAVTSYRGRARTSRAPSDTAVTSLALDASGPANTSTVLRGRDLGLVETVLVSRGGKNVTGHLQQAARTDAVALFVSTSRMPTSEPGS